MDLRRRAGSDAEPARRRGPRGPRTVLPDAGLPGAAAFFAAWAVGGAAIDLLPAPEGTEVAPLAGVVAIGSLVAAVIWSRWYSRRIDPDRAAGTVERLVVLTASWLVVLGMVAVAVGRVLALDDAAPQAASDPAAEAPAPEDSGSVPAGQWDPMLADLAAELEAATGAHFDHPVGLVVATEPLGELAATRWSPEWLGQQLAVLRALGLADAGDTAEQLSALLGFDPAGGGALYDPAGDTIQIEVADGLPGEPGSADLLLALADALVAQTTGQTRPTAVLDSPVALAVALDTAVQRSISDPIGAGAGSHDGPSDLTGLLSVMGLVDDLRENLPPGSPVAVDQRTLLDRFEVAPTDVPPPALGPGERVREDVDPGELGPLVWLAALGGRQDPVGALTAVAGWRAGSSLAVERNGALCVRSVSVFATAQDAQEFAFVAAMWASPLGADAALTTPSPTAVEVLACDPGERAPADEERPVSLSGMAGVRAGFGVAYGATLPDPRIECAFRLVLALADPAADDFGVAGVSSPQFNDQVVAECPG